MIDYIIAGSLTINAINTGTIIYTNLDESGMGKYEAMYRFDWSMTRIICISAEA